jgi:hypothetical protein
MNTMTTVANTTTTTEQEQQAKQELYTIIHSIMDNGGDYYEYYSNSCYSWCIKQPCVYVMTIGKAGDLLNGDYDSNDMICKFGYTKNLGKTIDEQKEIFYKEFDNYEPEPKILYYTVCVSSYHDTINFRDLGNYLHDDRILLENYKDLVIVNTRDFPKLKEFFCIMQKQEMLYNDIHLLQKPYYKLYDQTKAMIKNKKEMNFYTIMKENKELKTRIGAAAKNNTIENNTVVVNDVVVEKVVEKVAVESPTIYNIMTRSKSASLRG